MTTLLAERLEAAVITDTAPRPVARRLLREVWDKDGLHTLCRYQENWYEWDGSWSVSNKEDIRAQIWDWCDQQTVYGSEIKKPDPKNPDKMVGTGEFKVVPFSPISRKVADISEALMSLVMINGVSRPCWIKPEGMPPAQDIVCFDNGMIDTRGSKSLIPPTPNWFGLNSTGYDYNPDALCPVWDSFMASCFSVNGVVDNDAIALIEEWIGIGCVPDTSTQQLMLFVGRGASGKSTVIHVGVRVIGKKNVGQTSIKKMGERFAFQPLLDKLWAIMPDASLSRRADALAMVEAIKSISGEDEQPVDRKSRDELASVKLPCRITIAVNSLPPLPDEGGALRRRLLIVLFPNSFEGKEDRQLSKKLDAELPGIFNRVWHRLKCLRAKGDVFTHPKSSDAIRDEFLALVSPFKAFADEWCRVEPKASEDISVMLNAYQLWRHHREQEVDLELKSGLFCRGLKSAIPTVNTGRKTGATFRQNEFRGIKLDRENQEVKQALGGKI